jgi:hypothetical protein
MVNRMNCKRRLTSLILSHPAKYFQLCIELGCESRESLGKAAEQVRHNVLNQGDS